MTTTVNNVHAKGSRKTAKHAQDGELERTWKAFRSALTKEAETALGREQRHQLDWFKERRG